MGRAVTNLRKNGSVARYPGAGLRYIGCGSPIFMRRSQRQMNDADSPLAESCPGKGNSCPREGPFARTPKEARRSQTATAGLAHGSEAGESPSPFFPRWFAHERNGLSFSSCLNRCLVGGAWHQSSFFRGISVFRDLSDRVLVVFRARCHLDCHAVRNPGLP